MTADPTNADSSEYMYTKKPELNTSLMPMISYNPDQTQIQTPTQASTRQEQEQVQVQDDQEKGSGRRTSDMDIMAAITQLSPDLEAGPPTQGVRGSRKEVDDSVL